MFAGLGAFAVLGARDQAMRPGTEAEVPGLFSYGEPGISPDGGEIAFASGGDLWSVPAVGGEARLLVAHEATERRPLFSPDGASLAFVSTRTGGGDIYLLTLATGRLRRVTWDDGAEQLESWSGDSRWLYFSSTSRDIAGMNDIFRVRATGGTPLAVTDDRYTNEFSAAPSPDGRRLAFVARGTSSSQWWRRGSSHIDRSELWIRPIDGTPAYQNLTPLDARQQWPMWSGEDTLVYVSDRGDAENLWQRPATPGGRERRVTSFRDGRLLWPSITRDGRTVAFERGFGIWTVDTAGGNAREVKIARRGAATTPAPERTRLTTGFSDLALAPDGRKLAFVARGDIFAASAKDPGDATRVTTSADLESQPVWAPDSRRLVYVSARGAGAQLYLHDFVANTETALTTGTTTDLSPVFSPDGKTLAFLRNRKELRLLDVETRQDRVISTGAFADTVDSPSPVWSPDGRWIALLAIGVKSFTNVELVPVGGGVRRPVSFLSNVYANTVAWSRDGTFLLFDTSQRTEPGALARVDLTPRTPRFREDLFRDLFAAPVRSPAAPTRPATETPATAAPAPPTTPLTPGTAAAGETRPAEVTPEFADIRQRLSLLPLGLDVSDVTISPDGKTAVVTATSAGQANLYAWSLDELAAERPVARQLTTTTGAKANPQFSPDSREVYYLDAGRVQIATVERRESRPLAITAELTVDFAAEKLQVFRQAWTLLRDNFFDPAFNGVNWEASREVYGARAAGAGTADELRRLISLMIGDLNASHLGISAAGGAASAIGRLGLRFDRVEYEASGRLRISGLVPLGPAALARGVRVGDIVTAIDGRAMDGAANLDERLANTVNRRVTLTLTDAPGGAERQVVVQPTTQATEKGLLYREWVEANRQYVLRASGGRLGYVHMINMSQAALDQLHIDLDTENHERDGVVIDLRNNQGGFVNAYAIDVFSRRPYLRMGTRDTPEAPARTVLGQRALELPTVLVTNQHSLSDAEDFAEGYRTLKLGSVVGEATAGWIIYTWNTQLVDGSTFRLPRMRIRAADGSDMEMRPRPVDVEVSRPIGETMTNKDSQLDAAIRTLLRQLGRAE
jgi:tricorn protease